MYDNNLYGEYATAEAAVVLLRRTEINCYCAAPSCIEIPKERHLVALALNGILVTAYLPVCEKHKEWVFSTLLTPNSITIREEREQKEKEAKHG